MPVCSVFDSSRIQWYGFHPLDNISSTKSNRTITSRDPQKHDSFHQNQYNFHLKHQNFFFCWGLSFGVSFKYWFH